MDNAGLFGVSEAVWVGIGALVSAIAAGVTAFLAFYTRQLARETVVLVASSADERAQAERHHQELLSPIVFPVVRCSRTSNGGTFFVNTEGVIRNVGPGPSVSVNILIRPVGWTAHWYYAGVLGAMTERAVQIEWEMGPLVPSQLVIPYDCLVVFNTLFGTEGAVYVRSHSGESSDAVIVAVVVPSPEAPEATRRLMDTYFPGQPVGARISPQ